MAERIPPTQVYINGQPIQTETSEDYQTSQSKTDTQFFFETMREIDPAVAEQLLQITTLRKMAEFAQVPIDQIQSALVQSSQQSLTREQQQQVRMEIKQISSDLGLSPREPKKPSIFQTAVQGFRIGILGKK